MIVGKTISILRLNKQGTGAFSRCGYSFNGVNSDISINNSDLSSYLSGSGKLISFNIVVKRTGISSNQKLFSSSDGSIYFGFNSSNNLEFKFSDTTEKEMVTSSTYTNVVDEYYFSIIYDGANPSNSKIIANGIDENLSSNTLTGSIDSTLTEYLLGSDGSGDYYDGNINQFSVNNGLETLVQHNQWIENKSSPSLVFSDIVKLLNFDSDPSYDRVNSQFGIVDSIHPQVTYRNLNFDGTGTKSVVIANSDAAALNSATAADFTVFVTMKINSLVGVRALFGKMTTTTSGSFYIGQNTTQLRFNTIEGGALKTVRTGNGVLTPDTWIHAAYVVDGSNSKIYLNAVDETAFNNSTTTPDISTEDYSIGDAPLRSSKFVADVGVMQVVDKACSQVEVAEIFNNFAPIDVNNSSFASNHVYTFNPDDYKWDGISFYGSDKYSGIPLTFGVSWLETQKPFGGMNIAVTNNMLETDRLKNGAIDKGELVDRVFWRGQSNASGTALLSSLPFEYTRQRDDVQMWRGPVVKYAPIDGTFQPGYPSPALSRYGSQFSFTYKYVDYTNRYLYLDQYAIGGTTLFNIVPLDWNTVSVGEYFDRADDENTLSDIELQNNNFNDICEVWNQHESDCDVEDRALAYEVNLTNYINKRRLHYPNLPFIIVLVHADLPLAGYPYKNIVKQAQLNVAAALPNTYTLDQDSATSDMVTLPGVHRDAEGYEELGRLIFEKIKTII